MSKKKKLILLLFCLIVLLILCKNILTFNNISYTLSIAGNKIKVKETHSNNNSYIEIITKENTYPFRLYHTTNKRKIIKNIYLYSDQSIECVLPIINDEVLIDMMCYKNNILYDYYNIRGSNKDLDDYVDQITLYNINKFKNEYNSIKNISTVKYNIYENFNSVVALTTYKGLIINDKEINLFSNDIYNNKISTFIKGYYITADYDNKYTFNYFYVVNLDNKEITRLKSKENISYDSYIQGIVNDKVYLYDINNEIQYEIDIEKRRINTVSSNNYIKYYNNGKWEKMTKVKANKKVYFSNDTLDNNFTSYDYVKESDDYYYLFKKDGIAYKLYRVDKNNINVYKYLFNIPVTSIYIRENYLYYVYKSKLYYYSDLVGLKTILENSELEFNDTIKYYIY